MSCIKCQTLLDIPKQSGDLIVSCDVPEMATKMAQVLQENGINFRSEDAHTLMVYVDSFAAFLEQLFQREMFKKIERESIQILFLGHEPLTPVMMREMRSLQKYKQLIGSRELTSLIKNGALTTHFQPIVDIASNAIYGYESLARGVDDEGELIFPDRLFKWAREGEMLFYLDRACRESSLKTAAVKNIKTKVFINFIPTAIYDPEHCLQSTVKWAKQLEFDPKQVIFEVTESDYVADLDHLKKILDYYKSQGFMVALDDVGSGYSSLNMLAKLRPDIVKIDREIIDHIDLNEVNQSLFKAIVQIAKESNIIVLAEGIERVQELEFCAANGADLAQGYYFGKPNAEPVRKLH